MNEVYEYIQAIFLLSPLFLFIIAVSFRLLDNSGYLLLQKEILINSSYVSLEILNEQVNTTGDEIFRKRLKQVLLYRKLHRLFLVLMFVSLPITVWAAFAYQ